MIAVPVPDHRRIVDPRLRSFAYASLCFLAFFAMTDLGGQLKPEYGAAIAMLLMVPAWRAAWPELLRQPIVRWLAVFVVFVTVHAAYAAAIFPALSFSQQMSAAAEPVRLAAFSCVVGWWLSLMPRKVPVLFGLMIVGLLVAVVVYMPWLELPQIWDGRIRPRFGMPENLSGLLAALCGWLSLCLLLKLWNAHGRFGRRRAVIVLCLVAYVGSFSALLFSQSRGAWLAFAATLPAAIVGIWYWWRHRASAVVPWWPLLCVGLVSLLMMIGGRDIVAKRFAGAHELLPDEIAAIESDSDAAAGASSHDATAPGRNDAESWKDRTHTVPPKRDAANDAESSKDRTHAVRSKRDAAKDAAGKANNQAVSARMALYRFGVERWQERPLLGWGPRTTSKLIADTGLILDGQRHAHLHSAYLDALVGMGLAGAGLLGIFLVLALRELVAAWRSGIITSAAFAMVAGCIGIVLVANGFDSLVWRYDYTRAPLEILFGCCVAFGLMRRRAASPVGGEVSPASAARNRPAH